MARRLVLEEGGRSVNSWSQMPCQTGQAQGSVSSAQSYTIVVQGRAT